MRPSDALRTHSAAIRSVVAAHRACNARVFGSVLHGLDTEQSDLDILVDPTPQTTLMDVASIQVELEQLKIAHQMQIMGPLKMEMQLI